MIPLDVKKGFGPFIEDAQLRVPLFCYIVVEYQTIGGMGLFIALKETTVRKGTQCLPHFGKNMDKESGPEGLMLHNKKEIYCGHFSSCILERGASMLEIYLDSENKTGKSSAFDERF